MSIKKRILAVAAASALGAMAAVPAMAFENEFHGNYTLKYFLDNYENGSGGTILSPSTSGATNHYVAPTTGNTTQNLRPNNYFEQRARLFYTAKANDDLKLVTGFEIDSVWGDRAQGATFRNSGAALESDAVNLETKWVYLQFKIPSTPTTVTAGVQPFKDNIKGIFADFDAAGVVTATKLDNATVVAGYFRGYDGAYSGSGVDNNITKTNVLGYQDLHIGTVAVKYALSKDANVGLDYYIYDDSRGTLSTSDIMLHTFGLYGDAKVGPVALSGFVAYQGGVLKNLSGTADSAYLNALAYNVAAKVAVGPGTLRTALLFTSGNSNNTGKHLTGWVGTAQSQNATWAGNSGTCSYNESGMMLLNRNAASQGTTTDYGIAYNTGNGTTPVNAQGMYLYTLGYDINVTPKAFVNTNLGLLWAAHTNSLKPYDKKTGLANATNFQGTEINVEAGYKMYDNLTAKIQAAYVVLGGYYNGSSTIGTAAAPHDPDNPYTARVVLSYAF
ncbi:histidine kinase [Oryzomonas rubra]|uniref:Histidine kinase n=1 Tax=Oryzomonas rubra TaxID=2509454 RepID=A0A5A9XFR0_9BACT|nr:histidine kinase [Oryzomonas rubra]KAA0891724.1 histidine kinase [Oryzomonas rubra]